MASMVLGGVARHQEMSSAVLQVLEGGDEPAAGVGDGGGGATAGDLLGFAVLGLGAALALARRHPDVRPSAARINPV